MDLIFERKEVQYVCLNMKYILFFLFFVPKFIFSQKILVYGKEIHLNDVVNSYNFTFDSIFPKKNLKEFKAILIFSSANSNLNEEDESHLENYVFEGGNLYLGADNFPFVEECNQISERLFEIKGFGCFENDSMIFNSNYISDFSLKENYDSGLTTLSFPMNYKMKVLAWSQDNPIILITKFGKGNVILDGGYSRFYDLEKNKNLIVELIEVLLKN
jgi:hypothetical protein